MIQVVSPLAIRTTPRIIYVRYAVFLMTSLCFGVFDPKSPVRCRGMGKGPDRKGSNGGIWAEAPDLVVGGFPREYPPTRCRAKALIDLCGLWPAVGQALALGDQPEPESLFEPIVRLADESSLSDLFCLFNTDVAQDLAEPVV